MADGIALDATPTSLDAHPAFLAWKAVEPDASTPDTIEPLKESHKTYVYRLNGAGVRGANIIAKRRRHHAIEYEQVVHEQILAHLPVTSLRCLGAVSHDDETSWVFLEDSGGRELDWDVPRERAAATRWLAGAHTAGSRSEFATVLPDRGSAYYFQRVAFTRATLLEHIATNAALSADDIAPLTDVVVLCDELISGWDELDAFAELLPRTFTHGDFVTKNVHLRDSDKGLVVLPFDWETSGWGVPCADLARVDIDLYLETVRDEWPWLSADDAPRMAQLGGIFRLIASMAWEAPSFRFDWVRRAVVKMRLYHDRLRDARAAWGNT